jgi:hypothetical protein
MQHSKDNARIARLMFSLALVASAAIATGVDWNHTHLFHPDWHPHARFHGALFIFLTNAMCVMALWLLWRKTQDQRLPFHIALWVMMALWAPFFVIEYLVPGSSVLSHATDVRSGFGGLRLAVNQWIALGLLVWSGLAHRMSKGRG